MENRDSKFQLPGINTRKDAISYCTLSKKGQELDGINTELIKYESRIVEDRTEF